MCRISFSLGEPIGYRNYFDIILSKLTFSLQILYGIFQILWIELNIFLLRPILQAVYHVVLHLSHVTDTHRILYRLSKPWCHRGNQSRVPFRMQFTRSDTGSTTNRRNPNAHETIMA